MRSGLEKFIKIIKQTQYCFGGHEQAEKDYYLVYYDLNNFKSMTDKEILNALHDYGCPQPEDYKIKFDTGIWCNKIEKLKICYGADYKSMAEICPWCWKAFLEEIELQKLY